MKKFKADVISLKVGEEKNQSSERELLVTTRVVEVSTGRKDLYYSTDYYKKFTAEPEKGIFGLEVEEALKSHLDKNCEELYDAWLDTTKGQEHLDSMFVEDYSL